MFISTAYLVPDVSLQDTRKHRVLQDANSTDINEAHAMLDHVGEKCLHDTAKLFGWKLSGIMTMCAGCAAAKAQAIPKTT